MSEGVSVRKGKCYLVVGYQLNLRPEYSGAVRGASRLRLGSRQVQWTQNIRPGGKLIKLVFFLHDQTAFPNTLELG